MDANIVTYMICQMFPMVADLADKDWQMMNENHDSNAVAGDNALDWTWFMDLVEKSFCQ